MTREIKIDKKKMRSKKAGNFRIAIIDIMNSLRTLSLSNLAICNPDDKPRKPAFSRAKGHYEAMLTIRDESIKSGLFKEDELIVPNWKDFQGLAATFHCPSCPSRHYQLLENKHQTPPCGHDCSSRNFHNRQDHQTIKVPTEEVQGDHV